MKKTGILLLLANFSLTLFCQQFSNVNNDSTYSYIWDTETNDWAGDYRFVYIYIMPMGSGLRQFIISGIQKPTGGRMLNGGSI
jgi:hypothetical protein